MGIGVNFAGRSITHPGVYGKIDVSGMISYRGVKNGIAALIGQSKGGKPNTVYKFTSPKEAYKVLRGGDLLNVINSGWSAVADNTVGEVAPFYIIAIRVAEGATQASATLKDSDGNDTVLVTARDYGVWTNHIKVVISDGSFTGKKIEIWDTERGNAELKDNLGDILSIQYVGQKSYARMSISETNGNATELKIEVSDDDTTYTTLYDLDLTLPEFSTIMKVFQYLNGKSDISITLSPYLYDKHIESYILPELTDQDIKTAKVTVSSQVKLIMDYVNRFSELVTMEWASSSSYKDPSNTETYLTGGNDGTIPTDWSAALALLESEVVNSIGVLTDDIAIHNQLAAHVNSMNSVERGKPRFGVVGLGTGASVEDSINLANNFNNPHMVVAHGGVYKTLPDTGYSLQPAWFFAGMLAVAIATSLVRFPLTNKGFAVEGIETPLAPEVIDRLIENGVVTLEYVPGRGYIIPFAVTTYTASDNNLLNKIFPNGIGDYIKLRVDKRLKSYIGTVSFQGTAEILRQAVESELKRLLQENVITPAGSLPAWRNLEVTIENNIAYVSYETSPVDELDYILVTHRFENFVATAK